MQVRITDGTSNVVPRISEADLQGSRHRISVFLSTHTTYELLPESGKVWMPCHWPVLFILHLVICINSIHYGLDHVFSFLITSSLQVVALDVDLPVKQAFHILHEQVHKKEKMFLNY